MFGKPRLLGWSVLLMVITGLLTWLGFHFTFDMALQFSRDLFHEPPATGSILGWVKFGLWQTGAWLYGFVSRILAFYLSFLLAYSLSTPGYSYLSAAAEKVYAGKLFDADNAFSWRNFFVDMVEGIKIAVFGVGVTILALLVNFIPGIGQAVVVLLYIYYSTLMFIDFPASRRHWSLAQKLGWLRRYSSTGFRLGIFPALLSMIPIVNIFAIALIFPLLTIHATLNFTEVELAANRYDLQEMERS
jgi:CysZ protein